MNALITPMLFLSLGFNVGIIFSKHHDDIDGTQSWAFHLSHAITVLCVAAQIAATY